MENDIKLKLDVKTSSADGLLATANSGSAATSCPVPGQQNGNAMISNQVGNNHQGQNLGSLKSETSSNASVNGSIKKCSPATVLMNSREDVTSLGGGSSLNSQIMNISHGTNGKQPKEPFPHMYNGLPPRHPLSQHVHRDDEEDSLGPLPPKWEKAYTENGELYFIDHNTGTSHWLDPRLSKFQKKSLEECSDDELPYGWEKIHDPQYGTYFIDHVNRRTQYENPVLEAKRRAERSRNETPKQSLPYQFTKNPAEMCGERITTTLLKSSRGLGITIVGGDDNIEEFLQIKSIVPNGPAWLDGKLLTGDILVYVNDTCVLGFTHHEMVNVFQSILPGETVTLEVCRGYPLPFDPNDPNTEVVTTIAVDGINSDPEKARILMDLNMDGNYNFLDLSDSSGAVGGGGTLGQKNPLAKIQSGNGGTDQNDGYSSEDILMYKKPEILNISIIKGVMGFGFTIADSAYGQKVKKILDRNCCKNLQEGDILLEINNTSVKHVSHSEVVQVLKDCPKTQETVLKVQRGHYFSGGINGSGRIAKTRKPGGLGGKDGIGGGMYRSKTPTADLYSTQAKEVLPIRPKTPLVDTRRVRAKTPNTDLNDEVEAVTNSLSKNDDNKSIAADAKSNNSLNELDSINNEIPYMDPLPKLVTSLSERLAEASMLQDNHNNIYQNPLDPLSVSGNRPHYENQLGGGGSDYNYHSPYSNGNNGMSSYNTSSLYSPPLPMPLMAAPVPTYHQDACYSCECQDCNSRYQMDYHLQSNPSSHHTPSNSIYHQQYPPMMPPMQNGRTQKRVNEYIIDRRKAGAGFSPLENHQGGGMLPNQHFPQAYWKYGTTPTTGLVQAVTEDEYTLSEVTLERQALGFGFRIVGGTEEGSQVTVGHIVPGGSADGDSRIATGDEILSIDGVNVINASHHKVVSLMGEAALRGQVKMILRRRIRHPPPPIRSIRYPYDVIVSRNENEGFGFVIISSSNQYYGSTIGKLIPNSPAERCGELKVGDRIIAVNRIDIIGMSHGDVVNLIKDSGLHVRLTIGSPKEIPPLVQQSQPSPVSVSIGGPKPPESAYFDRSQLVQHPQL